MSGEFGKQQFQQRQFKHKPSDMAKAGLDYDSIKADLKIPAKGLLITGVLSVLMVIFGTVGGLVYGATQTDKIIRNLTWQMYGIDTEAEAENNNRTHEPKAAKEAAEQREKRANTVMTLVIGGAIISALILCSFYFFAVSGGVLMGQLRNYKVCRLACIMALIPVVSPLIVLGIPFGIMGLAKLKKPEVKKAFATNG